MTNWPEYVGTVATVVAIAGVCMNNRKIRACFIFWILSNAATLAIHVHAGIWSLAARDGVFFLLAIQGWFMWRRKLPQPQQGQLYAKENA